MREYAFVQTPSCYYRVFGRHHPHSQVFLLLRYFTEGRNWIKPPIYAAEELDNPYTKFYDLPLVQTSDLMSLGVGPRSIESYQTYLDPLNFDGPERQELASLQVPSRSKIGLSGSRLIGRNSPSSDVDLVVYGPNEIETGRHILDQCTNVSSPVGPSRSFNRFLSVARSGAGEILVRNAFTGLGRWRGAYLKFDINYCIDSDPISNSPTNQTPISIDLQRQTYNNVLVTEASSRYYFPGHIRGELETREAVKIVIKDHSLRYTLPGDIIDFAASSAATDQSRVLIAHSLHGVRAR